MKIPNRKSFQSIKKCILSLNVIALLFLLVIVFLYHRYRHTQVNLNQLRIDYKELVHEAEVQNYQALSDSPCVIIDTHSTVLFSSVAFYQENEHVNLHSISTASDDSDTGTYLVPLVHNDIQFATLLFFYEPTQTHPVSALFLIFLLMLVLSVPLISYCILHLLQKKVTEPIQCLCRLADDLSQYNYATQLAPCNQEELASLCQKLELIRCELQTVSENEKKMKEKEEFLLASISHDLKTPIAAIRGCAECILSGVIKSELDLSHYAAIILSKSELLTHMINSIIENSSFAMKDFQLHQSEVYLTPFLTDVLSQLSSDLSQHCLTYELNIHANVLISMDTNLIYQVIQNIISNSIKYTAKGGRIVIKTEALPSQNAVLIKLSDTGQGISHEDLPFVFDRFYRSEKARTQNIPGNGLGLSIVKNIIEKHNGFVQCESILGKGTTIGFSLPLA